MVNSYDMKKLSVISLIFSLLFISSCEDNKKSNDELLIGYWEVVEQSSIYEGDCEFSDGTKVENQTNVSDYSQSSDYWYWLFNDDKTWSYKSYRSYSNKIQDVKGTYHLTGGVISIEWNTGNNEVWDIEFKGEDNFNLDIEQDCDVKGKMMFKRKYKRKD